jgi:DNA-binding transcriptional regulator YiaG
VLRQQAFCVGHEIRVAVDETLPGTTRICGLSRGHQPYQSLRERPVVFAWDAKMFGQILDAVACHCYSFVEGVAAQEDPGDPNVPGVIEPGRRHAAVKKCSQESVIGHVFGGCHFSTPSCDLRSPEHEGDYDRQVKWEGWFVLSGGFDCKYPFLCIALVISFSMLRELSTPRDVRTKQMAKKLNLKNIREYRKGLGQNQQTFWSRFGVTQSGGSRYESGRDIPPQVAALMWLLDSGRLAEEDLKKAFAAASKQLA